MGEVYNRTRGSCGWTGWAARRRRSATPPTIRTSSCRPTANGVAVSVLDQAKRSRDIYVIDMARGVRQRLTFDPSGERSAVWTPDGSRLIFNSRNLDLYVRRSDFTGNAEPVLVDGASKDPREVSQDGRLLMYRRSQHNNDLWVVYVIPGRTGRQVAHLQRRRHVSAVARGRQRDPVPGAGPEADQRGGVGIRRFPSRVRADSPFSNRPATWPGRSLRRNPRRSALHRQHPDPVACPALADAPHRLALVAAPDACRAGAVTSIPERGRGCRIQRRRSGATLH